MNNAPSLLELQQNFAAAIRGDPQSPIANWVLGNGLEPEARLRLYRHMIQADYSEALRTAYPAVNRLVGEEFFDAAAARYLREHPSRSGNLQDYGAEFPAFLLGLKEARELAYLPDVARLEWSRQQAYLAADAKPLAAEALATIPDDDWSGLRFRFHPAVSRVASAYPILDIWLFCQEASPGELQLRNSAQQVLVWRDGVEIAMQEPDAGCDQFVQALLADESLSAASQRARLVDKAFDLVGCLHFLFENEIVTGFSNSHDESTS
ncbi:MAG: DNA-binding domain-containing protein [Gammaproteobacteria bacterium]